MQKYKLIHVQTKEEHLCDKVTIDGFDYYVSDESSNGDYLLGKEFYINLEENKLCQQNDSEFMKWMGHTLKRPIATNKPNIDIPKVVTEVDEWLKIGISEEENEANSNKEYNSTSFFNGVKLGYNKSQETYPFSEEDMIEFLNWIGEDDYRFEKWATNKISPKELFQLWKEQQTKIVYYGE
ncbi:hypothetical protein [Leptolyngbya phage Lbo-JY46]